MSAKRQIKSQSQPKAAQKGDGHSKVIYPTQYVSAPPPQYPKRALELRQQGKVVFLVQITPQGLVRQMKILSSSGHALLDQAAQKAIKIWVFEPSEENQMGQSAHPLHLARAILKWRWICSLISSLCSFH